MGSSAWSTITVSTGIAAAVRILYVRVHLLPKSPANARVASNRHSRPTPVLRWARPAAVRASCPSRPPAARSGWTTPRRTRYPTTPPLDRRMRACRSAPSLRARPGRSSWHRSTSAIPSPSSTSTPGDIDVILTDELLDELLAEGTDVVVGEEEVVAGEVIVAPQVAATISADVAVPVFALGMLAGAALATTPIWIASADKVRERLKECGGTLAPGGVEKCLENRKCRCNSEDLVDGPGVRKIMDGSLNKQESATTQC